MPRKRSRRTANFKFRIVLILSNHSQFQLLKDFGQRTTISQPQLQQDSLSDKEDSND